MSYTHVLNTYADYRMRWYATHSLSFVNGCVYLLFYLEQYFQCFCLINHAFSIKWTSTQRWMDQRKHPPCKNTSSLLYSDLFSIVSFVRFICLRIGVLLVFCVACYLITYTAWSIIINESNVNELWSVFQYECRLLITFSIETNRRATN